MSYVGRQTVQVWVDAVTVNVRPEVDCKRILMHPSPEGDNDFPQIATNFVQFLSVFPMNNIFPPRLTTRSREGYGSSTYKPFHSPFCRE